MTDPIPTLIPVYIPDAEARKFLLFQEHFETFSLMVDRDVFKQRNAAVTLHFDNNGTLQTIQRADYFHASCYA